MNTFSKMSLLFVLLSLCGFSALFAAQTSASQPIPDSRWENLLSLSPPADSLDQETEAFVQKQVKQGFRASLLGIGLLTVYFLAPIFAVLGSLGLVFAAIGWVKSRAGLRKLTGKRNKKYRKQAWFSFIFGSLVGGILILGIGLLGYLLLFLDWG